jgi:hypothetical protein
MTYSVTPTPVSAFRTPRFDARDAQIVRERLTVRASYRSGPQSGDWVRLHDGTLCRLAETDAGGKPKFGRGGSYYLEADGSMSYRGDWAHSVPSLDLLQVTTIRLDGEAWIFHHDQWRPDNRVGFVTGLRVWQCPHLRSPHY